MIMLVTVTQQKMHIAQVLLGQYHLNAQTWRINLFLLKKKKKIQSLKMKWKKKIMIETIIFEGFKMFVKILDKRLEELEIWGRIETI